MRFYEFKFTDKPILNEGARIQHAEDIIFWEGSKGAARALESLKSLEKGKHKDVTIKWDGSPAIIFGRDQDGNFILTDKSGFTAKGYDGKSTSARDLEKMLLNRKLSKGLEPEDSYRQFAGNMRDIFDEYEKATPADHVGFFKGDLLYFNTPLEANGVFVFKPNVVKYTVDANSKLGQQIAVSKSAVVVHNEIDINGTEKPLTIDPAQYFIGTEVLIVPPVTVDKAPQIEDARIKQLQQEVSKNSASIDKLLDSNNLTVLKLADFPKILYTYLNSKVDTGMQNLGEDFLDWLANSKVSSAKQKRIVEYVAQNKNGFTALWSIVEGIQTIKDDVINQFDNQKTGVSASINDQQGGEGYVLAHPEGAIKLVNRAGFTAANRAMER